MENYFERFLNMVSMLKKNKNIVLTNFNTYSSVKDSDIEFVENKLGCELSKNIKSFYKETDGLQLRWIHNRNPKFTSKRYQVENKGFDMLEPLNEYGNYDGCINILPLREVFTNHDWGEIIWSYEDEGIEVEFVNQKVDLLKLMQSIRPFDVFSKSACMCFYIGDKDCASHVLLAQDNYVNIEDSKLTDFESYMEFVLETSGLIMKRRAFYNCLSGHKMPVVYMEKGDEDDFPQIIIDQLYS